MRCVVASDRMGVAAQVREILLREGHQCQPDDLVSLDLATTHVGQARPELVIVVMGSEPEDAFRVLLEARRYCRGRFLIVGPASDSKLILRALREGADQYLDEGDLEAELQAFVHRLHADDRTPTEVGKLIVLLAPSGGSGVSTIAVNMATVFAKEHKKCALLDLKLPCGDLAALLDLRPTHTLANLCSGGKRIDQSMFERALVPHSSGVHLLSPTNSLAELQHITAEGLRQVVILARSLFPYVVVDLDQFYREEQFQVLRQADEILLVLRLDFSSLRNARRTLEYLAQSGINRDRVKLAINRYGQPREVPYAKAEEALDRKIAFYIPDDPTTINQTNNAGVPAVLEYPRAKISKTITSMAQSLNGRKH